METNIKNKDKLEVEGMTEYIKSLTLEGKIQFSTLIKGLELGMAVAAEKDNEPKSA